MTTPPWCREKVMVYYYEIFTDTVPALRPPTSRHVVSVTVPTIASLPPRNVVSVMVPTVVSPASSCACHGAHHCVPPSHLVIVKVPTIASSRVMLCLSLYPPLRPPEPCCACHGTHHCIPPRHVASQYRVLIQQGYDDRARLGLSWVTEQIK